ncbi:MAG: ATP-binding protein [Actinomycetota bacterium]|nr:ATP-binding protein [Actinomycetota bacterium]
MYHRSLDAQLRARLLEPRRFIQVVWGPRQVGKTTSVDSVLGGLGIPTRYASADTPAIQTASWIREQWELARLDASDGPVVLALDEVQKVPSWSEHVKALWDEDTRAGCDVRVVVLGSSPLLMQAGLAESLAGRFETLRWTHWTFAECRDAFAWDVETFLFFGGYPGAATLVDDVRRWRSYIVDSLIETSVSRDILLMTRVDKPALLRQLFALACEYSGQILSYTKMLGQLADAGNTTTLAHYLMLLEGAGLVAGLRKYTGGRVRRRASSPKLQVMNTGLMTAISGREPSAAQSDLAWRGRLVESAVGAYLFARKDADDFVLHYWRQGDLGVDFVVEHRDGALTAIEVKSGPDRGDGHRGMNAFLTAYPTARPIVVGAGGVALERVLLGEVEL